MFHKICWLLRARTVNVYFMDRKNVRSVDSIPKPWSKSRCINFALTARKRCYGVTACDDVYSVRYKIMRENNRRPPYVAAITFPNTCHFHGQMDVKRKRKKRNKKKVKKEKKNQNSDALFVTFREAHTGSIKLWYFISTRRPRRRKRVKWCSRLSPERFAKSPSRPSSRAYTVHNKPRRIHSYAFIRVNNVSRRQGVKKNPPFF